MGANRARSGEPSDAELRILEVLWDHRPLTVRDTLSMLRARGYDRGYNTVQTLLERLVAKQLAHCDDSSRAHVYRPKVSRESLAERRLRDELRVAKKLGEGSIPTSPLARALGESLSRAEVEELIAYLRSQKNEV